MIKACSFRAPFQLDTLFQFYFISKPVETGLSRHRNLDDSGKKHFDFTQYKKKSTGQMFPDQKLK